MSNETKNDLTGKIGIVTALDTATCKVRVKLPDHDDLESYWLPVLQGKTGKDKQYWMPDPGEHVICLVDENAEFGVVLGAIYSDADTPPTNSPDKLHITFSDATWVEYDRSTGNLTIDCVNNVTVKTAKKAIVHAGGEIEVQAPTILLTSNLIKMLAPEIILNGAVEIGRNLHVGGDVSSNGSIIDTAGNTNHHVH